MQFSSLKFWGNRNTVHSIMTAKVLDVIVRQPSTYTMNHMTDQMEKLVSAVKKTAWGGQTWIP